MSRSTSECYIGRALAKMHVKAAVESEVKRKFNQSRVILSQAHGEYQKHNLVGAHRLFRIGLQHLKRIPKVVAKNRFSDAERILAEAKQIFDDALPAYRECQARKRRVAEGKPIRKLKGKSKMEDKMEETSLTDHLERALRLSKEN